MTTTDHGLLLSAPMVRAYLRGDKTSTMRPITTRNSRPFGDLPPVSRDSHIVINDVWSEPRIQPGHTIWFRETFALSLHDPLTEDPDVKNPNHWDPVVYRADVLSGEWARDHVDSDGAIARERIAPPWRSALHMPRWAARCLARVTEVYARRPCDLSGAELHSEGFPLPKSDPDFPGALFEDFWRALHPDKPLDTWCWFYRFTPLEEP